MTRHIRLARKFWRARKGTAAVEFAMVLPVLTVLLFGAIDIGRLLVDYHAVSKSIRDATRYLTRIDATAMGLSCSTGTVDQSSAPAVQAMMLAMTGSLDGSTDFLLPYWNNTASLSAAGIAITVDCFDNTANTVQGYYAGLTQIPSLVMSAQVSFPFLNGFVLGRGNALTFTIRHKEVHFGQ
ncbi:MAG: TadE/TadG family type IV pilus assembly protein [Kiloniellaceae bacterium]